VVLSCIIDLEQLEALACLSLASDLGIHSFTRASDRANLVTIYMEL